MAESDFSSLPPYHIDSEIDKQLSYGQFCRQDIPKIPQVLVQCVLFIVRFSNISWMSSPPPFLFPQGRGKFQYLSEKNTLPCLGHCKFFVVFFYLQLTLCTHMEKNFSRTRYPFYFSQTFTKYIRESSFKSLGDPFAHRQLHSPQFVMLCGGSSCYF